MMDELEDDIPDEFKGTLQITRDVSKSEDLGKTSPSNGSETSSVDDKILGSNVNDDSTVESPPKTLLTNITEKSNASTSTAEVVSVYYFVFFSYSFG